MGSSCEANGKIIDPSVGGLVWVRRRNGSWWPGRILGPDELPDSCLVSPRSGTPVKLLGREDASVDWYNLEKSKRVKAFRCGEYDDCIEKAKASASVSCKKAVKYARREDAILHALELESSRSLKTRPVTSSQVNKSRRKHLDEDNGGALDKLSGLEYNSNSPPEGVSFEATCRTGGLMDRSRLNDSEDDGTDGLTEGSKKRMRGLKDLGVVRTSSVKRRRSQAAHVHDFLKKKNRRRQLTKVLESTTMVTVPVMIEDLAVPNGGSDHKSFSVVINNNNNNNNNNSDSTGDASNSLNVSSSDCKRKGNGVSSVSGVLENGSSVRLFDVPFIGEEKATEDVPPISVPEKPQSNQSSLVEPVSIGTDELQESGSISSGALTGPTDKRPSKWQLKRKRNSRNKTKPVQKPTNINNETDTLSDLESHPPVEPTAPQRQLPYRQSRFTLNPKYQSSDLAYTKHDMGTLYEVNIEVKADHRPQHVPYISLVSKLTGQPITGHPVQVEPLDGDSLNGSECRSGSCGDDDDAGVVKEGRKPRRNGVLCSNKKTRKLSSLTGSKRPNENGKNENKPVVACVPLKVVFGRLYEALGCGR